MFVIMGYVGGAEFESPSRRGKAEGIKPLYISSFYIVTCAFASYILYKSPFRYEYFSIYSFQNCANSHLLWRIMIMIHLYIYLGTTCCEN